MDAFGILPSSCRPFEERAVRNTAVLFCTLIAFAYASTLPMTVCRSWTGLIAIPAASIPAVLLACGVGFCRRRTWVAILLAFVASIPIGYGTSIFAAFLTGDSENVSGALLLGWAYGGMSGIFLTAAFVPIFLHARLLMRVRPVDAEARMHLTWGIYVAFAAAMVVLFLNEQGDRIRASAAGGALMATPIAVVFVASAYAIVGAVRTFRLKVWVDRVAQGAVPGLQLVPAVRLHHVAKAGAPRATLRAIPLHAVKYANDADPYRASPEAVLVLL